MEKVETRKETRLTRRVFNTRACRFRRLYEEKRRINHDC